VIPYGVSYDIDAQEIVPVYEPDMTALSQALSQQAETSNVISENAPRQHKSAIRYDTFEAGQRALQDAEKTKGYGYRRREPKSTIKPAVTGLLSGFAFNTTKGTINKGASKKLKNSSKKYFKEQLGAYFDKMYPIMELRKESWGRTLDALYLDDSITEKLREKWVKAAMNKTLTQFVANCNTNGGNKETFFAAYENTDGVLSYDFNCWIKKVRETFAMDARPDTMEQALDTVRWCGKLGAPLERRRLAKSPTVRPPVTVLLGISTLLLLSLAYQQFMAFDKAMRQPLYLNKTN